MLSHSVDCSTTLRFRCVSFTRSPSLWRWPKMSSCSCSGSESWLLNGRFSDSFASSFYSGRPLKNESMSSLYSSLFIKFTWSALGVMCYDCSPRALEASWNVSVDCWKINYSGFFLIIVPSMLDSWCWNRSLSSCLKAAGMLLTGCAFSDSRASLS